MPQLNAGSTENNQAFWVCLMLRSESALIILLAVVLGFVLFLEAWFFSGIQRSTPNAELVFSAQVLVNCTWRSLFGHTNCWWMVGSELNLEGMDLGRRKHGLRTLKILVNPQYVHIYIYNYMYMIVYVYVYIVATVCECASIYIYIIILYINIYQ